MTQATLRDHAIYYAAKTALEKGFDRFYVTAEVFDTAPPLRPPLTTLPPHAAHLAPPPPQYPRIHLTAECLEPGEIRIGGPRVLLLNAHWVKAELGRRLHIHDFQ